MAAYAPASSSGDVPQKGAGRMPTLAETRVYMDTFVTIEVARASDEERARSAIESAFGWFNDVERACSRFDTQSELSRLCATSGDPVEVSPLLFKAIEFAVAIARESGGAFDPAVGAEMERQGFDQNYRTGEKVAPRLSGGSRATFRDIALEPKRSRVTLSRPMQIDLGAVAKGFAIDLAAKSLGDYPDIAINAGGDIFGRGRNPSGKRWRIGLRNPRNPGEVLDVLHVAGAAVCTSGDYERGEPGSHHIIRPSTGESAMHVASATVVAPTAMLADAVATAAFVLGPNEGIAFIERTGVEGLLVTPDLERFETPGFARYRK